MMHWAEIFQWDNGRVPASLAAARRDSSNVYGFFLAMRRVYLSGSVLTPDSKDVATALCLAAQAGTAIFAFQQSLSPPKSLPLGDGPEVSYAVSIHKDYADVSTWAQTFDLSVLTRQPRLIGELCAVPKEVFDRRGVAQASENSHRFMALKRLVWAEERFDGHPLLAECEEICRHPSPKASRAFLRSITEPYLKVLRQLGALDAAGFNDALTNALESHKAYWSSFKSPEPGAHMNGFVSLQLTAAAALAWDRGLRFDVESDYTPTSWVRGTVFQ
jgi:hypothetical protein